MSLLFEVLQAQVHQFEDSSIHNDEKVCKNKVPEQPSYCNCFAKEKKKKVKYAVPFFHFC